MALAETEPRNPRAPALTAAEKDELVRARDAALASLRSFAAKIDARRPSMTAPLAVARRRTTGCSPGSCSFRRRRVRRLAGAD